MTDPEPLSDAALARLVEMYAKGPVSSEKARPDGGYPEWVLWHAFPAIARRLRLAEAVCEAANSLSEYRPSPEMMRFVPEQVVDLVAFWAAYDTWRAARAAEEDPRGSS